MSKAYPRVLNDSLLYVSINFQESVRGSLSKVWENPPSSQEEG